MRCYYKLIHLFFTRQANHVHYFGIGIYDEKEKAMDAVEALRTKDGFCLRPDKFHIFKVFRLRTPRFLNRTYWVDGFSSYPYAK